MQIAIVGTGAIGSTFAFHLAKAGHAVTVIARGARLAELQRDKAIVLATGERAEVTVSPALDTATPWDLVLVTVLASQVDAVMPALKASAAKTVMFMFNTFEPLDRYRDAVGAARCTFGFPAIIAYLIDGKLQRQIVTRGQITTVGDAAWAKVFGDAGIVTVVHDDMQSWLRSHVVFVAPLMAIAAVITTRGTGISWSEARTYSQAMDAGFQLVRQLGNTVTPSMASTVSGLPAAITTSLMWAMSRSKILRDLGKLGPGEVRTLIDQMVAASPGTTADLAAIRP